MRYSLRVTTTNRMSRKGLAQNEQKCHFRAKFGLFWTLISTNARRIRRPFPAHHCGMTHKKQCASALYKGTAGSFWKYIYFFCAKNPSTSSLSFTELYNPLPLLLGVLGPHPHHLLQRLDALHHLSKEDVSNTMDLKKV